jgi:GMP synthase (glutamine-hydrolysing)
MQRNVLILDFGSQVTQLIARRVREAGIYAEIHPYYLPLAEIRKYSPKAIILSGGPASLTLDKAPSIDRKVFEMGVPVLGICYGEQLTCSLLGGRVEKATSREFGRAFIEITEDSPLFAGLWQKGQQYEVWMSHGDHVTKIPAGFKVIAKTASAPFAAIANEEKKIYGVQFHPEVTHTPLGEKLLANFVHNIAGLKRDWNMKAFRENAIEKIRKQVGKGKILCAVSGGVDSSVVAKLLHEALAEQLQCIFVDTGLLRKDEGSQVEEMFRRNYNIPLLHIDAAEKFLKLLKGVSDPEAKRKIIGKTFIDVFDEEAKKIGKFDFLAQGTLYPDIIESVSFSGAETSTIKSHHNVGGLPERMNLKLVEPVRELFKDEVRALGKALGMSDELIKRHPFPGPGLAIRIPGEITKEKIQILQEADAIYMDEIKKAGLYDKIWQAFAVLLPVKTVGVMGDSRTYEFACALRAVTSSDGMTADFYQFDHQFLGRAASRIINEVRGINRIVYDITSKPPGTIEWE